jgi:hypothetical protein
MKFTLKELALYQQCVNEVLRGFHMPDMERTVGVSYAVLMKEDAVLFTMRKSAKDAENTAPVPVRPLVIAETIHQLGADDFATRTGYTLDEGYLFLEKAKKAE